MGLKDEGQAAEWKEKFMKTAKEPALKEEPEFSFIGKQGVNSMNKRKTTLTEGYRKEKEGYVALPKKIEGIGGIGKEWYEQSVMYSKSIYRTADILFKPIDEDIKTKIKEELETEFTENKDGYVIDIDDVISIYADTERAKLYAILYLLDIYEEKLKKALVYNYPLAEHRSARVFFPPKKEIPYFKKFIDLLVYLGYHAILLEISGVMEFKKHPEINSTWASYCRPVKEYNDKIYDIGRAYYRPKNAVHCFNGGGEIYSQDEVKELVRYCEERYIEIIPEIPQLSHSEYLLISHPELRECDDEPFASTACPSNPDFDSLIFDLYDEVIDVFHPKTIHIGHDEWWVMCICDKCKKR